MRYSELLQTKRTKKAFFQQAARVPEAGGHFRIIHGVRVDFEPEGLGILVPVTRFKEEELIRKALEAVAKIFGFVAKADWEKFEEIVAEAFGFFRSKTNEGEAEESTLFAAMKEAFLHAYNLLLDLARMTEAERRAR